MKDSDKGWGFFFRSEGLFSKSRIGKRPLIWNCMYKKLLIGLICSLQCWAFAQELAPGPQNQRLFVDGALREVFFYVPESYDGEKAVPMVMMFHGAGENGQVAMRRSGWQEWAEEKNAIVMFPSAGAYVVKEIDDELPTNVWAIPRLNGRIAPEETPLNDLALVDSVYDFAMRTFHLDPSQIYATGFDSGADMALWMAFQRPHYFAAFGLAGGPIRWDAFEKESSNGGALRIAFMVGTEDEAYLKAHDAKGIPFNKGTVLKSSVGQTFKKLQPYCAVSPSPFKSTIDGNLMKMDFRGREGQFVRLMVVEKMGHEFANAIRNKEIGQSAAFLFGDFFNPDL